MSSKFKAKKSISMLLSVLMIVGMFAMALIPASAEIANDAVKADANGVLQIRATLYATGTLSDGNTKYTFKNEPVLYGSGTSFLINSNTILTCAHVINPDEYKALANDCGLKFESVVYEVVINKDVTITCTLENYSVQDDYAILTLNKAIGGKSVLKLADSSEAEVTQKVYALGFPELITQVQKTYDYNNVTYNKDDVTITEGNIQKIASIGNTKVLQHGCATNAGNSGGPIVDENGAVLGITKWKTKGSELYNYATSINEVREVLDTLLISYEVDSDSKPVEEPSDEPTELETEPAAVTSSNDDYSNATNIVKDDLNTNNVNNTKMILIIAIIAIVIILVAVVVVILIVSSKKKNNNNNGPQGGAGSTVMPVTPPHQDIQAPQRPQTPAYSRPQMPQGAAPTVPSTDGAGETSVLSQGAGETTVLGNAAVGGFTMLRKANNQKISINKPDFVIGKERRKVDYCIDNNNSISRTHAKMRVRSGKCYIMDLGSTNCTFVNGTKLSANQEIELKAGDKIKLSDEEFEYIG